MVSFTEIIYFEIERCPGSKHTNADSLSQLPMATLVSANYKNLLNLIVQP